MIGSIQTNRPVVRQTASSVAQTSQLADTFTHSRGDSNVGHALLGGAMGGVYFAAPAICATLAGIPFGTAGRVIGGLGGAVVETLVANACTKSMDKQAHEAVTMWTGIVSGISGIAGAAFGLGGAITMGAAGLGIGAWMSSR